MSCKKCQDGIVYTCNNCGGQADYDYEFRAAFCDTCEILKEEYTVDSYDCPNCNSSDNEKISSNKKYLLFFDTETTGLPKNWKAPISDTQNWPRLVQLAYHIYDDSGNIISENDFIIYPDGYSIPYDSTEIHGISDAQARASGKPIQNVLSNFLEALSSSHTIVGHNINYDINVVGCEFIRNGLINPFENINKICTMESSTNFCAINGPYGYKWPKLSELHFKLFGRYFEEAHNASIDIKATADCFWELVNKKIIKFSKEKAIVTDETNKNSSRFKKLVSTPVSQELIDELLESESTRNARIDLKNYLKENNILKIPIAAESFAISYLENKLRQSNDLDSLNAKINYLRDFWSKSNNTYLFNNLTGNQIDFIQSIKKSIIFQNKDLSSFDNKNEQQQIDSFDLIGLLFSIENKQSRDLVIYIYYYYLSRYIDFISKTISKI